MTPIEQAFAILGILILCIWACVWMVDDWMDDRERRDKP